MAHNPKLLRPSISEQRAVQLLIDNNHIEFIRFEQNDSHGISRSKTVPARHWRRFSRDGINFFQGVPLFGPLAEIPAFEVKDGYPDSMAYPDCSTFQILPWADSTARVLIEPVRIKTGEPDRYSTRFVCRLQLERLEELGFQLYSSHEYEFIVVHEENRKPIFGGKNIMSTHRNNKYEKLMLKMCRDLSRAGVDVHTANTEYAPGQIEITYGPTYGIRAADNAFTFRTGVKEICQQDGKIATFMSWPFPGTDGIASGGHYNHSLWSADGEKCVFWDEKTKDYSETGRHWIGGLCAHAPALHALFNPTPNCHRRTKDNTFAPSNISWGYENRTCMLRCKKIDEKRTYIEHRLPGAAANPYLVTAGVVAAGMDGIKNKIEPPEPCPGTSYGNELYPRLPATFDEALEELKKDEVMVDALGKTFINAFVAIKEAELKGYKEVVESGEDPIEWERKEYFDVL